MAEMPRAGAVRPGRLRKQSNVLFTDAVRGSHGGRATRALPSQHLLVVLGSQLL